MNAITPDHGATQQFAGLGSAGRNTGTHRSAERDPKTGYPRGHGSFAGIGHANK